MRKMEGPFDDEIAKSIDPHESAFLDGDGIAARVLPEEEYEDDDGNQPYGHRIYYCPFRKDGIAARGLPEEEYEDDDIEVLSPVTPTSPGQRSEPKVSLSAYESVRSLSASGEITAAGPSDVGVIGDGQNEKVTAGHVEVQVDIKPGTSCPPTSTPVRRVEDRKNDAPDIGISPVQSSARSHTVDSNASGSSLVSSGRSRTRFKQSDLVDLDPINLQVPLVGYEVMEERARFTVFKLHVHNGERDNWFVFRRYTDFTQLQQKLKKQFPMFRIPLPAKRWFRDNYEREFLEERMKGLQAFVDSLLCHKDLCNSHPVQEFFCFNDPPGPHDSVEESRAYCEELEEALYSLKKVVREKDSELEILRDELNLYKSQVEILTRALREHNINGATAAVLNNLPSPASSLAECDLTAPEADQSYTVAQAFDKESQSQPLTQPVNGTQSKTLPETEVGQATAVITEAQGNVTAPAVVTVAKNSASHQPKKDNTRRKSGLSRKWFSTER